MEGLLGVSEIPTLAGGLMGGRVDHLMPFGKLGHGKVMKLL